MSTQSASNRVNIITTQSSSFERFAGLSAILAGRIISWPLDYPRSKESHSFGGCAVERVYC